ncbi:hypothetical protein M0R45_006047 [Rubus argutus]|uniref:Uncharacterized protein n=1 Tax=Rubus argutus TaxID=59490 RepID=A0AAW1YP82_RUBAR
MDDCEGSSRWSEAKLREHGLVGTRQRIATVAVEIELVSGGSGDENDVPEQLLCDWARLGSVEAMGWRAWGRGRVDRGGGDEVTAKVGCAHGGCVDVAGLVEEGRSLGEVVICSDC